MVAFWERMRALPLRKFARALSLLSSTLHLRTLQNRSRREQLSSRSSLLDLSFLEPVIGLRLHGCETYWTYVEARVAGLSITCRFVMETSLPVTSEVSAHPSSRMSIWL